MFLLKKEPWFNGWQGQGFSYPDWLWGPPSLLCNGNGIFSLRLKWLGHEADHLAPSSVEVKNEWSYNSIPHMPSWQAERQLYSALTYCIRYKTVVNM